MWFQHELLWKTIYFVEMANNYSMPDVHDNDNDNDNETDGAQQQEQKKMDRRILLY